MPERAQVLRVILLELQRISSHLLWLGTSALDLAAMSVFLYGMREAKSSSISSRWSAAPA